MKTCVEHRDLKDFMLFSKVGCNKKGFTDDELLVHKEKCKRYQALPVDRWGKRLGEEPDSPTLQAIKKHEQENGTWQLSEAPSTKCDDLIFLVGKLSFGFFHEGQFHFKKEQVYNMH